MSHGVREIKVSAPNQLGLNQFRIGADFGFGDLASITRLEWVCEPYSGYQLAYNMHGLRELVVPDTWVPTSLYQCCYGCYALQEFPFGDLDLTSVTNAYQAFYNCYGFRYLPDLVVGGGTWESAFQSCTGMQTVGDFTLTSTSSGSGMRNVRSRDVQHVLVIAGNRVLRPGHCIERHQHEQLRC